ncbi:MAG: restriction endonuclease subunit S [Spongiibacter sp.]|nr:restriction endonuclease subunit S [Spongiibacter sp.]
MGRYQSYKEYQSSGVDWLQEVPKTWELTRLGKWFSERRETVSDKDYAPLSVTMQGIVPQVETAAKSDAGDNRKKVVKGDFVINSRSDRKGSSGVADRDGSVSLISIVLEPKNIEARFVHHLMRSQPFQEEFYRYGKGIVADLWSTKYSDMKNIRLALPSRDEQKTIARFLDHETAKIDELIAKQERLIELLKEKRQAVISHAVTKGLNPDVPMKDSGVEWLGEVPEHWCVGQMGFYAEVTKLTGFEYTNVWETDESGEIIALRGFNIKERFLDIANSERISSALSRQLSRSKLKKGDVVFPCTGTLGNAAEVTEDDRYHINQNIAKISFSRHVSPSFAVFWLTSSNIRTALEINNTSAMQPVVLIGDLRKMCFVLPPKDEQEEIVRYLDNQEKRFRALLKSASHAVTLLGERRTALISAAVTGKIDVRNWKPDDNQ